jgi:uncharacterized protein YkwD
MDKQLLLIIIGIVVVGGGLIALLLFGGHKVDGSGDRGSSHSYTGPRNSSLSSDEVNQFINLHNQYRQKTGASPLKWNINLAAAAQSWADHQKNNENCKMRHPETDAEGRKYLNGPVHDVGSWGQNIAWFEGQPGSPEACMQGWGPRECPSYPGDGTGHFSQLVWKATTEVGCGKASCGNQTLWVCDYNPGGNVQGEYGQNVTKPKSCSL